MFTTSYHSSDGALAVLMQRDPVAGVVNCRSMHPPRPSPPPALTWLVSKRLAMLTLSVTPSTCRLKLELLDFQTPAQKKTEGEGLQDPCCCLLIDQDLRIKQGPLLGLQLMDPEQTRSRSWLLLIVPQVRTDSVR